MNKRLEKFSKLIEQRRRAKAVEPAETQNASVGVGEGKVTAPVAPELPTVEEPAQVPEVPVAEEPVPEEPAPVAEESAPMEEPTPVEEPIVEDAPAPVLEEPVVEEPSVSETPNRSRKRRGKKSKVAGE